MAGAPKTGVVGAGPAGLLFALRAKRGDRRHHIVVLEQNALDATFGFGVVFCEGALAFLERDGPQIYRALTAAMQAWPVQKIVHRDEAVIIDGNGFSAIARLELLQLLERMAAEQGVELEFDCPAGDLERFAGYDLVVGADGVNSTVR